MADVTPLHTVGDRLRGARRSGFVGRAGELDLFLGAIDAPAAVEAALLGHLARHAPVAAPADVIAA